MLAPPPVCIMRSPSSLSGKQCPDKHTRPRCVLTWHKDTGEESRGRGNTTKTDKKPLGLPDFRFRADSNTDVLETTGDGGSDTRALRVVLFRFTPGGGQVRCSFWISSENVTRGNRRVFTEPAGRGRTEISPWEAVATPELS